jgi:TolB-like protein
VRVYALHPQALADPPAARVPPATSFSLPIVAPRLSIVVLPFANLSSDPEQGYFADGITEDLTTDLSRIAGMFVISRNTAFTYQNKRIDTKQIGRELGVRYVLEGSVRRTANRVRVNAQLIDAETDTHLWVERFDGGAGDLLALQDEIASRIANAPDIELIEAATDRPTEHPDALDYILRGRATWYKPRTSESIEQAISLFEHALVLDPQSAEAQSRLAAVLGSRVLDGMTGSVATDLARAEEVVNRALVTSPRHAQEMPRVPQRNTYRGTTLRFLHLPAHRSHDALRDIVSRTFISISIVPLLGATAVANSQFAVCFRSSPGPGE